MVHLDQLPNYLEQKVQNNNENLQNMTNLPCMPHFSLHIIFDLAYHPRYYIANYPQKFLPKCPQHNLVAHPQATSTGNSVAADINLEVLILLGELFDLLLYFLIDFPTLYHFTL